MQLAGNTCSKEMNSSSTSKRPHTDTGQLLELEKNLRIFWLDKRMKQDRDISSHAEVAV